MTTERLRRTARSLIQLLAGLALGIPVAAAAAGIAATTAAAVAGWFAGAAILITYVVNALEDGGYTVPGMPKRQR